MSNRFTNFSDEENQIILNRIAELMGNGATLKSSYETIAEELQKPMDAVKRRHIKLRNMRDSDEESIDYRKPYSTEEDAIVYSRISAARAAGIDLVAAHTAVAEELGRPVGSVQNRWGRIKAKMSASASDSLTGLDLNKGSIVMLKLKGLVSEVSDFRERETRYKSEIRELKRELTSTQKELHLLKTEYEKMLNELHLVFNA